MIEPRWRTVLTVAPYVIVGMLAAFALGVHFGDWAQLAPTLALCAAAAALILVLRDVRSPWRARPAAIVVLLSAMIVINLLLILRESWFGFLTIATFSMAFSLVPWPWKLLPVAATAALAGIAQSSGLDDDATGLAAASAIIALNMAAMCGLAWGLHLAQQHQQAAATDGERARIAREIHDTLAQGLAGIVTQLQAAEQAPDDAARSRHTTAALALAREGLIEARRSMRALRPAALDQARLPDAIEKITAEWSTRTQIRVRTSTTGARRDLPIDTEVALLRAAQEALANVEHHARARRVDVVLRSDDGRTRLEIRDDGRGMPTPPVAGIATGSEGGYGLIAMRERLEAVAGSLVVESRTGHGTAIRAEVPS